MKIKIKYYYPDKGKFKSSDDQLILMNRHIFSKEYALDEGKPFYYDDTYYDLTFEAREKKHRVVINRLITEANYTTKQKEYLTRLSWLQKQKLLWMFKRHWLQQPGNMLHLIIVSTIITLALVGYEIINTRF